MFQKRSVVLWILLGLVTVSALPASAGTYSSYLNSAAVADTCSGYQITLSASGLPIGDYYTIYWTINIDGVAAVNNDFYEFDATALTQTVTLNRTWSQYGISLTGNHTFTGQALLVGVTEGQTFNTVQITFSPSTISCPQPQPLKVTCSAINTGTVGVPFNSGPETVTGGTPPYTFSVGGTLPVGLTLNPSNGAVSGTPTATGTFTINVTDSKGVVGTGCKITINPSCLVSQLGSAGGFSILGLQGANIQLSSGPLKVNGNVGIGVNGLMHLSGGATLQSRLFADPSAQVQIDGGSGFAGGVVFQPMTAIQNAALAEATSVGSLHPTQTFSQITNATTIIGNGGRNVIQVNGQVHLSGGQNLTISGGANDTFIFNIANGFQLDGGANIVLNGVSPNQVLFYFPGSGDQIQTSGNADTEGIFLAPSRTIQINGGVHSSEFISGGPISFQSNPVVNSLPACVAAH